MGLQFGRVPFRYFPMSFTLMAGIVLFVTVIGDDLSFLGDRTWRYQCEGQARKHRSRQETSKLRQPHSTSPSLRFGTNRRDRRQGSWRPVIASRRAKATRSPFTRVRCRQSLNLRWMHRRADPASKSSRPADRTDRQGQRTTVASAGCEDGPRSSVPVEPISQAS